MHCDGGSGEVKGPLSRDTPLILAYVSAVRGKDTEFTHALTWAMCDSKRGQHLHVSVQQRAYVLTYISNMKKKSTSSRGNPMFSP